MQLAVGGRGDVGEDLDLGGTVAAGIGEHIEVLQQRLSIAESIPLPLCPEEKLRCSWPSAAGEMSEKTLTSAVRSPPESASTSKSCSSGCPLARTVMMRLPSPPPPAFSGP